MPKKTENEPEVTQLAEENDAEDPRSWEASDAQEVREGNLSAAQMEGGHGNVDPDNPDAQYPPGVVDNSAAVLNATDDPASFVPEKKSQRATPQTTSATPSYSYGTSSEQ